MARFWVYVLVTFGAMTLTAIIVWVNLLDRKEQRRRATLPAEERKRLAEQDEADRQGFSF